MAFDVLARKQQRKPGLRFICYYFPNILNYMVPIRGSDLSACDGGVLAGFDTGKQAVNPLPTESGIIFSCSFFFPPRPVPGSLSSLLHLHNRQRQPMPASMPGTLPNPTMPGSSAVLMPVSASHFRRVLPHSDE